MKKYLLGIVLLSSIFLITGCGKKIVGKWKAIESTNEYYYIFNNDNTCSYELAVARLDCTYEDNGKNITILYKGNPTPSTYEYQLDGDTMIIKDDNGNDNKFIREK